MDEDGAIGLATATRQGYTVLAKASILHQPRLDGADARRHEAVRAGIAGR